MHIELGIMELATLLTIMIGAGWAILKLTFNQFEQRLDNKFEAQSERIQRLEVLTLDVKRLEVELVKRDSMYVPRNEFQSTFDRIFELLRDIQRGLDGKVSKEECDKHHK